MDFRMGMMGANSPAYRYERNEELTMCTPQNLVPTNGIWQGERLLQYDLPLFILQIMIIFLLTRALHFFLKPLRQQRIIAEILVGVLLGPTVMGQIKGPVVTEGRTFEYGSFFWSLLFPLKNLQLLETMANVGIIYHVFLIGVETDLNVIKHTGRKALITAFTSMGLAFLVPVMISFNFSMTNNTTGVRGTTDIFDRENGRLVLDQIFFLSATMAVTSFPTIARILTEHKLINTEVGRLTMSSAIIVDVVSWSIISFAVSIKGMSDYKKKRPTVIDLPYTLALMVFWAIVFILFCVYVVRPYVIMRLIKHNPEGEHFNRAHLPGILIGVMTCAFVTEWLGFHAISGAFIFGLLIPNGPLAAALVEKLEDFMAGLLVPLYYVVIGLKVDFGKLTLKQNDWIVLMTLLVGTCAMRVGVFLLVALFLKMQIREGITLGLLMNTKGLVHLMIFNISRDRKLISRKAYPMGIPITVILTSIISPLVALIYRSSRGFTAYKNRTFQRLPKVGAELRVVACVHIPRQVPAIINLLENSNPSKESPIGVYAVHLVELAGHGGSAMLTINSTLETSHGAAPTLPQAQSDHIVKAFKNFESTSSSVNVQTLNIVSPYSTMHEDICNLAQDKRATLIILPFHKQRTIDGTMEVSRPEYRIVNQNVLANAPCSVGILIDRGLAVTNNEGCHHIAMLFFGGPDDREGLTYAQRLVEQSGVRLRVIRFLPGSNIEMEPSTNSVDRFPEFTTLADMDIEMKIDNDYITTFRLKTASNEMIVYSEVEVNNVSETVQAIRRIDKIHDLYIVGREQNLNSALTEGLTEWAECPELGIMGDLLASSDFEGEMSVLVIQQYGKARTNRGSGWSTSNSDHDTRY